MSKTIRDMVFQRRMTTFAAWHIVRSLFLNNATQRAVYALQDFHNLQQGDLSVGDNCCRLKRLADTLSDVGHPVTEQDLVVNTVRSLSPKFSNALSVINAMRALSSFSGCTTTFCKRRRASIAPKSWRPRPPCSPLDQQLPLAQRALPSSPWVLPVPPSPQLRRLRLLPLLQRPITITKRSANTTMASRTGIPDLHQPRRYRLPLSGARRLPGWVLSRRGKFRWLPGALHMLLASDVALHHKP